jgi:hypothetical protein
MIVVHVHPPPPSPPSEGEPDSESDRPGEEQRRGAGSEDSQEPLPRSNPASQAHSTTGGSRREEDPSSEREGEQAA